MKKINTLQSWSTFLRTNDSSSATEGKQSRFFFETKLRIAWSRTFAWWPQKPIINVQRSIDQLSNKKTMNGW